ncbi:hypothetical protein [Streptomyces sp. NPDC002067]
MTNGTAVSFADEPILNVRSRTGGQGDDISAESAQPSSFYSSALTHQLTWTVKILDSLALKPESVAAVRDFKNDSTSLRF